MNKDIIRRVRALKETAKNNKLVLFYFDDNKEVTIPSGGGDVVVKFETVEELEKKIFDLTGKSGDEVIVIIYSVDENSPEITLNEELD
jgi:hypothetical protein